MGRYDTYENVLYRYLSGSFLKLPYSYHKNDYPKGWYAIKLLILSIYSLFKSYTLRLLSSHYDHELTELKDKVWFFTVTKNNFDSLNFLSNSIIDSVFVGSYSKAKKIEVEPYRLQRIFNYPLLLISLKRKGYSLSEIWYLCFSVFGYLEIYKIFLGKLQPKLIVFSNDHTYPNTSLQFAAQEIGIPTVYIQHASISEEFPPVSFDLSLLDGEDTYNKYLQITGKEFNHRFIGMPKFDEFIQFRKKQVSIKTIGISLGDIDSLERGYELVVELIKIFPLKTFVLRLHPSDTRDSSFFNEIVKISDSKKESAFSYLKDVDLQICGDSGIHLEATMLNIPSVYYSFRENGFFSDSYGFIENGLIDSVKGVGNLINKISDIINNPNDVYLKAKPYNALIGTEFEGKSSELAVKYIYELLDSKNKNQ